METQNNKQKDIMLAKNVKTVKPTLLAGAICLDVLNDPKVQELVYEYEGKRYLNIKVVQRKEKGKFGATHFIAVDQYKKGEGKKEEAAAE
jgi:hypothetical protein